jgi:hypothetical protein
MSVIHTQDSNYAKEMRKWEARDTEYGRAERPHVHRVYPTMMYRAGPTGKNGDGPIAILAHRVAKNDDERADAEADGFVYGGQQAAMDAAMQRAQEHAELAAEREYEKRHKLSEKAAAEVTAVEAAAGARHLPNIPQQSTRAPRPTTRAAREAQKRERAAQAKEEAAPET